MGEAEESAPLPHGLGVETADTSDDLLRERRAGIDKHMNRREKAITAADPGERARGVGSPLIFRPN